MIIKFNDNGKSAGTFTFYSDPGHSWLKVPFSLLDKIGIAEKISSYSYRLGSNVYLEEDCDFTLFRNAMGAKGLNFRIKESIANNRSKIRDYPHYSAEKIRGMPEGVIGEKISYGGQVYIIRANLGRRGFEVWHDGAGMTYRLPKKYLSEAVKA